MAVEVVKLYTGSIASGASSISIDVAKGWSRIYAQVPTMSTAAQMEVYGSTDDATYLPIYTIVQTATTMYQIQSHTILSGIGANGGIVPIYGNGCRYLQFRASAVVSGGVAMTLICSD